MTDKNAVISSAWQPMCFMITITLQPGVSMRHGFTLIELMIVIAIIAIIAAIAIPNLMESRVTANEANAAASMKSGIFPGEVQFQAGGYQDIDVNNQGEFGTMGALCGLVQTVKMQFPSATNGNTGLKLLQGPLAIGSNWTAATSITVPAVGQASGYWFTSYVGSEVTNAGVGTSVWYEGAAAPLPTGVTLAANANNGYQAGATFKVTTAVAITAFSGGTNTATNGNYYIVVAAPAKYGDTGRRIFCMTQDGMVRSPAKVGPVNRCYGATIATVPVTGASLTATNLGVTAGYALDAVAYAPAAPTAPTITPSVTMFDDDSATKQTGTAYWEIYSK
jgi:prepilin-type N-terminal cleavage/methylation domain-containing protein